MATKDLTKNGSTDVVQLEKLDIQNTKHHYQLFNQFKKEICKSGIDFGIIPGTKKPTLFKAGAEKLLKAFRLFPTIEETQRTVDLETGFVDFEYKVIIRNNENFCVGEGIGSCNSFEDKYLYTAWKPQKNKPTAIEQKQLQDQGLGRFRKDYNSGQWVWNLRSKKPVTDLIALKNTIQKMAKKRAFVDATLMATGGGEFFTQDIEDMTIAPDSETLTSELVSLASYASSFVKDRNTATELYKLIPSVQRDPSILAIFQALSNKFPQ